MEYFPQDSVLLNIARERLGADLPPVTLLTRERHRQLTTVLDACTSDTQMFVALSDLLYACETRGTPDHSVLVDAVQTLVGPA